MLRKSFIIGFFALLVSCGSSTGVPTIGDDVPTQTTPLVSRVDPTAGTPGTPITIFGLGFSLAPPQNIIVLGDTAVAATSYQLLSAPTASEVEAITFDIPAGTTAGQTPVVVVVDNNPSNADVVLTVLP